MIGNIVTVVILLGAPGAGKGTVADYLKENYNVVHFSTGNLLRDEVKKNTEIGKKVASILETGGLVDDEIVNKIIESRLPEASSGGTIVLLDGYPRTVEQAKYLDSFVKVSAIRAIEIDVRNEVIISRIAKRLVCDKCKFITNSDDVDVTKRICPHCGGNLVKRADDTEAVVRNRLEKYAKDTLPVSGYYGDRLMKISGEESPDIVVQRVDNILCSFGIVKKRR